MNSVSQPSWWKALAAEFMACNDGPISFSSLNAGTTMETFTPGILLREAVNAMAMMQRAGCPRVRPDPQFRPAARLKHPALLPRLWHERHFASESLLQQQSGLARFNLPPARTSGVALIIGLCGCFSNKHNQGRSSEHQIGVAGGTNAFGSSVTAQVSKNAATNSAPAAPPDNTAQNKMDQSDETLTPMDQGGSDTDRHITQELRRAIVQAKGSNHFSFLARNVKIITINNEVTLRGVVSNEAEKERIQALAQHISGVTKVHNELGVKGQPSAGH